MLSLSAFGLLLLHLLPGVVLTFLSAFKTSVNGTVTTLTVAVLALAAGLALYFVALPLFKVLVILFLIAALLDVIWTAYKARLTIEAWLTNEL